MLFKNITILDENFDVRENMYVVTKGPFITYVGSVEPKGRFRYVVEGRGRLLMPAFCNSHTHTYATILRGYGGGLRLGEWLSTKIFPFEGHLDERMIYNSSRLGIAEMLQSGTVSCTEMCMYGGGFLRAVNESGFKANYGVGMISFDPSEAPREMKDYIETLYFHEHYHNASGGKIKIDTSIHAEYTSHPKAVEEMCYLSKSLGTNMNVHLSETKEEHENCKEKYGKTPAQYFNDLGMFESPTTAAHCNWLEPDDIKLFAEKGVTVASCPVSNMKLASGICDVKALMKAGVRMTIGTDGVASNNNLDMIEEMKFYALAQKVKHLDPTLITPKDAIYAATRAGFLAQGRKDSGLIKEGFRADLIVLDIDQPHMRPVHSLLDNIVYSANGSDVEMTFCDGELLYKNGEFYTIDVEEAYYVVDSDRKSILKIIDGGKYHGKTGQVSE